MKKGFTLVELVITTIIMALLIGLLFEIFILIARIAVKVEHERAVHNEIIYVMQTIQNLIDQGTLELDYYADDPEDFDAWNGVETTLTLWDPSQKPYDPDRYAVRRGCDGGSGTGSSNVLCLEIQQVYGAGTVYLPLTDISRIEVTNFYIKVLQAPQVGTYEQLISDGFWLFMDVRIPHYNEDLRWFRVDQQVQTFFNLRKY